MPERSRRANIPIERLLNFAVFLTAIYTAIPADVLLVRLSCILNSDSKSHVLARECQRAIKVLARPLQDECPRV